MKSYYWADLDLSRFSLEPSIDRAVIELRSNNDGSVLAVIECSSIIMLNLESALGPNGAMLPVSVVEVTVETLDDFALDEFLETCYGFRFGNSKLRREKIAEAYVLKILGGEIEAILVASKCIVSEP
jgi:hypothetical protein